MRKNSFGSWRAFSMMAAAVAFVAVSSTGCLFSPDKDKPTPVPTPQYVAPTSPKNVLENFILAHKLQDIAGYRAAIDEDVFEFRSQNDPPLTFDQDLDSTTNMFDEALGIDIRLVNNGAIPSDLVDEYPPENGYMMIPIPSVFLEVRTNRDAGAGPITFSVPGDLARFMFKETDGVWKIVMQEDLATDNRPAL